MRTTMSTRTMAIAAAVLFISGVAAGAFAARQTVSPSLYVAKPPADAARALLDVARVVAEDGSWENIYVGRTYYLGGMKEEGERILDRVATSKRVKASDHFRIGKAYADAGNWEKAKAAFQRVETMEPDDTDWLVEVGAYYNLNGDRQKAEELFGRAFARPTGNPYNVAKAAGSYVGVTPQ
jgi:tetratricopeptide (TPR) repeat protein